MSDPAPEGLRFECTECGVCCTRRGKYAHVYVSDDEVDALAEFLNVGVEEFLDSHAFTDELGWTQIRFVDDRCPFLDPSTNRCRVYPARPVQCSTFPFWREYVARGSWTAEVAEICEGIGRGPDHPAELVEANMRAMEAWDEAETDPDC